jgi:hypothetical protein
VLTHWRFLYGGYHLAFRMRRFCDGKWGEYRVFLVLGLVGCVVAE